SFADSREIVATDLVRSRLALITPSCAHVLQCQKRASDWLSIRIADGSCDLAAPFNDQYDIHGRVEVDFAGEYGVCERRMFNLAGEPFCFWRHELGYPGAGGVGRQGRQPR